MNEPVPAIPARAFASTMRSRALVVLGAFEARLPCRTGFKPA